MLDKFRNVRFIKAMMWIVAAAFIGLIVFEWGADFTGRSTGPIGTTIGAVNGEEITHQHFQNLLREASRRARGDVDAGADLDEGLLIREIWNQLVTRILMRQQMDHLNITVSDVEVDHLNRVQPVAWVRDQEIFQTDGEFDSKKYAEFLNDPTTYSDPQRKQFVLGAESAARRSLRTRRLQEYVASSVRVTSAQIRQAFLDQHEKVRSAYVGIDARSIPDSLVSASNEEIRRYYDANRDRFFQDAAVMASYVTFPKIPTREDTLEIRSELDRILSEIRGGADFNPLARAHSEDPGSAQKGGDLGFFGRGQMVQAFEDTAFVLTPGTVSEPFLSPFGWHILKVEERKEEADGTEVRARHILLRIRPGRDTSDSLRLSAEAFRDRAQITGFDAAVAEYGFTASTTGFLTPGTPFPLLEGRASGLINAFLEASPGEISPIHETDDGIYLFSLIVKRDEGPRPLREVRSQVFRSVQSDKKVDIAKARLNAHLQDLKQGKSLKEIAEAHDLDYFETETFTRNDFVPNVGRKNAFIATAFQLQERGVSDVVTTSRGAYVIQSLERPPVDESEFNAEKSELGRRLMFKQGDEVFAVWFADLRDRAEIVDNRHHFYPSF